MSTFDRVRKVVVTVLQTSEEKVTLQTSLMGDLSADSMDMMEVIMALEEEYDIQTDDETFTLTTIAQIVDYIDRLLMTTGKTQVATMAA